MWANSDAMFSILLMQKRQVCSKIWQDTNIQSTQHFLTRSVAHTEYSPKRSRTSTSTWMFRDDTVTQNSEQKETSCSDEQPVSNTSQSGHIQRPAISRSPVSFIDPSALSQIGAQNMRLLPKTRNPLHIIDGPCARYFVGIIDFFTLYECWQRTARVLKGVKYHCGDHSTIPPAQYANRFVNSILEHTSWILYCKCGRKWHVSAASCINFIPGFSLKLCLPYFSILEIEQCSLININYWWCGLKHTVFNKLYTILQSLNKLFRDCYHVCDIVLFSY